MARQAWRGELGVEWSAWLAAHGKSRSGLARMGQARKVSAGRVPWLGLVRRVRRGEGRHV